MKTFQSILVLGIKEDGIGRGWYSVGRYWANSLSDSGARVLVFPGTYGIEFTQDEVVSSRYGIKVE